MLMWARAKGWREFGHLYRSPAPPTTRDPADRYAAATPSASSTDTHGTPTASATGAYVT